MTANVTSLEDLEIGLNTGWVLLCAFLVFWEQAGFAFWEAGGVRAKNLENILLKNVVDVGVAALSFWAVGYALAFGKSVSGFLGADSFFLVGLPADKYAAFFFQFAFAATAATTVSGCVAERTEFHAYLVYATLITGFIYPPVVHWVWSDDGWLCAWGAESLFGTGFIDFAGSGVVHMLGGLAGLVGTCILGPRRGRFEAGANTDAEFRGCSARNSCLGVFCLWFGCQCFVIGPCSNLIHLPSWIGFGFNSGYTLGLTRGLASTAALVCINTALAPAAAALVVLTLERRLRGVYDLPRTLDAVVAGLVGITGPCGVVEPWAAVVIGALSGAIYSGAVRVHVRLRIDDPVGAVAVHAWPGLWGCLASGFFATPSQTAALGYSSSQGGAFYGGGFTQLGAQAVGILAIAAWTCGLSAALFGLMHRLGVFRVSERAEKLGLDLVEHGVGAVIEPLEMEQRREAVKCV